MDAKDHPVTPSVLGDQSEPNELTPLTDFLPTTAQHWLSVAISVGTAILTFLKANEHWVDDA